MSTANEIRGLPLHPTQLLALVGLERPCSDFVHSLFSTFVFENIQVENSSILHVVLAQVLFLKWFTKYMRDA